MTVSDLGVTSRIVGVLFLIILFSTIGITYCTKNLKLSKQEYFLRCCSNIRCNIMAAASIVRIFGCSFQNSLQIRRHSVLEGRTDNSFHQTALPTARVTTGIVHIEPSARSVLIVVTAINKCQMNTATCGRVTKLEVDTICTFLAAVMVNTNDIAVISVVQ